MPQGTDLAELLLRLEIPSHLTAIELNGELLDDDHGVRFSHGDRVEIVRFVGGG